jgi:sulfhydrogenase subunit alpha
MSTIRVKYMARVEGEASLSIKLKGERVQDVKFKIFEPPRLFEALLPGRHFSEAPDITSRICGICPVAYQMTSVQAIERALGVIVDPMTRLLRRLFYAGEWLESHTLHVWMLHVPDFLDFPGAIEMARQHPQEVADALRLKKIGNRIISVIGGREIHPVSAAVGGFYKTPSRDALAGLKEDLKWALDAAIAKAEFVAGFDFPDFEQDYEFVALSHPSEYPLNEGRLISNKGLNIDADEYTDHFIEHQVKHSNALHSAVKQRGSYLTGPLARFNLNYAKLPAIARQVAVSHGFRVPCLNPFKSIVVRAIEMVFAIEEALRIIDLYEPPAVPRVKLPRRAGAGHAITEAPRGSLYIFFQFDQDGIIQKARIVPPTSQNQKRMEEDLLHFVPGVIPLAPEELARQCERVIRNYDPCISCATHFLKVDLERC